MRLPMLSVGNIPWAEETTTSSLGKVTFAAAKVIYAGAKITLVVAKMILIYAAAE